MLVIAKCSAGVLICGFAFIVSPAFAGDGYGKQQSALDFKLAAVQAKIAQARARESVLNKRIGSLDTQIHGLEARAGDMAGRISALQTDLALRHRRLDAINTLFRVQTSRVHDLQHAYRLTLVRLDNTLVTLYKSPQSGTLDLVLQAKSIQDILDELTYLGVISKQQEEIAHQVAAAKQRVTLARQKTSRVRRQVADQANLIRARLEQVSVIHNELLTSTHRLSNARAHQSLTLLLARAQEQASVKESDAIEAASTAIEAKIQAAQQTDNTAPTTSTDSSTPAATPSAAGLIWPVNGPITSPFGPRWGGFHPGIDIGVPTGTPIHAAAAGTVIWCGWETGYGNLVVIDHHNGLATAYAHQSRIAVSCNQDVSQGQVIGYVGCTGFCTGPHLHFEVRVNGTPVDPLAYLP